MSVSGGSAVSRSVPPRYRRIGLLLSTVGAVLIGCALIAVFGGAIVLSGFQADSESFRAGSGEQQLADLIVSVMSTGNVMLCLLIALCFLITGEQLRRGGIGRTARPQTTILPKGSYVSSFRPLSSGWHLLWAVLALTVALLLIVAPVVGTVNSSWPTTVYSPGSFSDSWLTTGMVALALACATWVSLFKKQRYFRRARITGIPDRAGERGTRAWRWLTFRWRLDIWCAGVGGLVIGLSALAISSTDWSYDDPNRGDNLLGGGVILLLGLVILGFGLWMASNYWKSGEPIGSGESFS